MNICFFGASVTAQKTGYVHYFNLKNKNSNHNVAQFGYGSMHIKDAGMCFIDEVLNSKPDYCFLDWFDTAYIPKDSDELICYLDNFRYKFIKNDCQIIFLLLSGSKNQITSKRLNMYEKLEEYANFHSIPCINIHEQVKNYNTEDLFKDTVHTLDFGSELYADIIYKNFTNEIIGKKINYENLLENKYSSIKKIKMNEDIVENQIEIEGFGEVMGIYQWVGPHSGLIDVIVDGVSSSRENLWDFWCNYERKVIKIQKEFSNKISIVLSQEDFDRSGAKSQVNWTVKKIIKPIELYYIGSVDRIRCDNV